MSKLKWTRGKGLKSVAGLVIFFNGFYDRVAAQAITDSRASISVTLTAAGPLNTFIPPADCSKFSAYSTETLVFGENTRSFTITSFRQGCQYGGPRTTCCPPNYELGQYNSPGVCPNGYTTLDNIEFVAVTRQTEGIWITYPAVGTLTGKLCCPSATETIKYTADGPVPLCLASSVGPTITQRGSVVNQQSLYFASAVVVVPPGSHDPPLVTVSESDTSQAPTQQSQLAKISSESNQQLNESTASGAQSTQSQEATTKGESKSGLSGGAIAGIVIGIAIPIILVGLFSAYRLGKRTRERSGNNNQSGRQIRNGALDNGREPGVSAVVHIGGIQDMAKAG
ncbi:hypothetical protein TWF694_001600 [Orbilia ellipsospora]|uniref:Mid2 domain-containing protein n=1 Tax=Orbilia ellipsospora TaxID=2528407 RepID=A0AAV9X3B1_9PEZI